MSAPVGTVPAPNDALRDRGYGTGAADFAGNHPTMTSPLGASSHGYGELGARDAADSGIGRSASTASTTVVGGVSRNNTLKKRSSVRRTGSVKRSSSRRSMRAGSIKGYGHGEDDTDFNSAFHTPIPTTGSPTEALADRFQAWRQLLKSLIAYFREIQSSYETRAKAVLKVQNTLANLGHPAVFMNDDGLGEASRILLDYHKRTIAEANKSRDIEDDVIGALTGLRSDLGQKIKEIKSLSGDFKNSVEKEKDATRREVEKLQDALANASVQDPSGPKGDPYVVRLGVDRAIEKQIDEENYLHRAYLNLESSGRELESIVVGEIQKAYNALAGILKRESEDAYTAVENLRTGPIALPKDQEWYHFVTRDESFVDPSIPLRRVEDITYPGKHHPAATEIRAGMLERKSKYLKSYTPGWYVLSPTHLHEFKSADKIYSQPPVMSLYLPDQKLGSHSETGSSSHKFMLKGKQTGGLHKGHNWVFRAESNDTMLAWFDDIKNLTEKTGEERNAFVRQHARSVSGQSDHATFSSDGLEEDEADQTPYSADVATYAEPAQRATRPQPGGRFPSDLAIRTIGANPSDRVADESEDERPAVVAAAVAPPVSTLQTAYGDKDPYRLSGVDAGGSVVSPVSREIEEPSQKPVELPGAATPAATRQEFVAPAAAVAEPVAPTPAPAVHKEEESAAPIAAAAVGGAGLGAIAATHSAHETQPSPVEPQSTIDHPTTISGDAVIPPTNIQEPVQSAPSVAATTATTPSLASTVDTTASEADAATVEDADATPMPTASTVLGGNEAKGAHTTGSFFPTVVRHNTDISVSQLHVPGEFPKKV